jgi:hypothetical protein
MFLVNLEEGQTGAYAETLKGFCRVKCVSDGRTRRMITSTDDGRQAR